MKMTTAATTTTTNFDNSKGHMSKYLETCRNTHAGRQRQEIPKGDNKNVEKIPEDMLFMLPSQLSYSATRYSFPRPLQEIKEQKKMEFGLKLRRASDGTTISISCHFIFYLFRGQPSYFPLSLLMPAGKSLYLNCRRRGFAAQNAR